jgi:hypothetical protein
MSRKDSVAHRLAHEIKPIWLRVPTLCSKPASARRSYTSGSRTGESVRLVMICNDRKVFVLEIIALMTNECLKQTLCWKW